MDLPEHWGTTAAERARRTPADDLVAVPTDRWTRGATSTADSATLWRWLCQLTVAPYSYDLVDNWSWSSSAPLRLPRVCRSPRTLTPGAEDLQVGQRLLMIFVVDSFVSGEHLTIRRRTTSGPVGEFAVTYAVHADPAGSRLTATVVLDGTGPVVGKALAWGDLVMMRRQLTLLCALAAR
ncbi:hypothetical protein GCM10023201_37510 [Actinomycetospora corticicola]|uniref:Polyketide cyclase/dehydrase/lipid transport protein n=1 Tax=Actinomycetospora corticicola TaxID=663602 RepID=A0A7Y9DZC6_9PSEU|nr:hypothetical protein [Actinomycetospora corticicola]NYD38145.1 hypothetical protein [Actinomycetospora corticicola]